jgi:hypothetical protein
MTRTLAITAQIAVLTVTGAAYADQSKNRLEAPRTAASYSLTKPLHGATMWFADRYASVYYTVDKDTFEVVTTIVQGMDPLRTRARLRDGETNTISIGGYGHDAPLTTLNLSRVGDELKLRVDTEPASN